MSPLTVIGELLILGGLGVFGYIVWQPWHSSVVVVAQQLELTTADSAAWDAKAAEAPEYDGTVPVPERPAIGEQIGNLHIPAFGTTFASRVGEGTGWWETLNYEHLGVGHYPSSAMPGEVGNVAMAGHRSGGFPTPFREIMNLRVGDPIFFETEDGWYTYRFRSLEYVLPSAGEVINAFPYIEASVGDDQLLTLTTCHPKAWGSDERAIAYSMFESFQPRADGPPAELIELNPAIIGEDA